VIRMSPAVEGYEEDGPKTPIVTKAVYDELLDRFGKQKQIIKRLKSEKDILSAQVRKGDAEMIRRNGELLNELDRKDIRIRQLEKAIADLTIELSQIKELRIK